MNFVAFRFCDNDFHIPLREAIEYVVDRRLEELTLESFREYVLRGMVAFNSIRRIDNWSLSPTGQDTGWDYDRYRKYFEETLEVTALNSIKDLPTCFEGYVYDNNTFEVHYHGY
jgi:hypothetical protein